MREYVVTVIDPKSWDTLWTELTTDGLGDNYVPKRTVDVANERPVNEFCAHFMLSDEEAEELKQDARISNVELLPELRDDIELKVFGTRPDSDYNRDLHNTTAGMKNWGLLRSINSTNNFGNNLAIVADFPYNLDGTGVDIIVVDSGVEPDHPEFAVNSDGTGGSRVRDFDWSALAVEYGIANVKTSAACGGYLGDADGHGSNCASIAAGNTCGWASGADIYSLRIYSGYNIKTNAPLQSIVDTTTVIFDLVTAFHLKKIAQAAGGPVRPTICTNSWGYSGLGNFPNMQYTNYRGTQYNITTPNPAYGQVSPQWPVRVTSIDADVLNCSNAGVILVGAAGNSGYKQDIPGGNDYDNFWYNSLSKATNYYHRGSSPTAAPGMVCVGAIDSVQDSSIEQKAYFSNCGPRVDIWAPGVAIMGAYANKSYYTYPVVDERSPAGTDYYLNKISGTSQACPQVTGLLACILQARPEMTAQDALKFIAGYSIKDQLTITGAPGYENITDLQDAPNRYLYMPFNNQSRGSISNI